MVQKISNDGIYIINKENKYKFYKYKEIKIILDCDDTNMILWTSQSIDSLTFFINYILEKKDNKVIEELLKSNNTLLYILDNKKNFLIKSKLYTDKDYTLKRKDKINDTTVIKKLGKSKELLTYLK